MPRFALTCSVLLALACAACSKPEPPDTERPPEPQAPQSAESQQQTQMRDAMQAPLEKAKGVEDQVLEAAKQQQAAIDAQTGG